MKTSLPLRKCQPHPRIVCPPNFQYNVIRLIHHFKIRGRASSQKWIVKPAPVRKFGPASDTIESPVRTQMSARCDNTV